MRKSIKRKLRISHIHWGFPPVIGGVETHLTILLPTMIEMGNKVSLLTGTVEGCKAEDTYKGVKVYRAPLFDLNWLVKRGLHGIEAETREVFNKFIDDTKPDILHHPAY